MEKSRENAGGMERFFFIFKQSEVEIAFDQRVNMVFV